MSLCPCNPWNQGGPSVQEVCGNFVEPENHDQGQCSPYRVKRSCEAPVIPSPDCPGNVVVAEYVPSRVPPFRIYDTLFDQDCETITDENGDTITTYIQ